MQYIDHRIESLRAPMVDFDKRNYELERVFKDGGAYYLKRMKEILKDD